MGARGVFHLPMPHSAYLPGTDACQAGMCAPADAVCIEAYTKNSIQFAFAHHARRAADDACEPRERQLPKSNFVYFLLVACVALIEFRIFTRFAGRPAELHAGPGFCIRN
jgi:hypothetical protein